MEERGAMQGITPETRRYFDCLEAMTVAAFGCQGKSAAWIAERAGLLLVLSRPIRDMLLLGRVHGCVLTEAEDSGGEPGREALDAMRAYLGDFAELELVLTEAERRGFYLRSVTRH